VRPSAESWNALMKMGSPLESVPVLFESVPVLFESALFLFGPAPVLFESARVRAGRMVLVAPVFRSAMTTVVGLGSLAFISA
jgi:hypothetical protein